MSDVTQGVIFKIGSVGGAASAGDIAKVTVAFVALKKALGYIKEDLLPLAKIYSNVTKEQRDAADALGEATGGQLDTVQQFRAAIKLNQAALPEYSRTLSAMGKVVVDFSQSLGESSEQAGARLNSIIEGVVKGTPAAKRQLAEYGIVIQGTAKNAEELKKQISEAFIEKADQIELNVKGIDTQLTALSNALGDVPSAMVAMANQSDVLVGVVSTLTGGIQTLRDGILDMPRVFGLARVGMENLAVSFIDTLAPAIRGVLWGLDQLSGSNRVDQFNKMLATMKLGVMVDTLAAAQGIVAPTTKAPTGGPVVVGEDKKTSKGKKAKLTKEQEADKALYGNLHTIRQERNWRMGAGTISDQIDLAGGELDAEAIRDATDAQRLFNETKQQQLEILREKVALMGQDPDVNLTLEEKQILWDAEYEHEEVMRKYEEERLAYLEIRAQKEASFAQDFKAVWMDAMSGVRAGTLAGQAAFAAFEGVIGNVITSLITTGHVSGKVIARMVRDVAIGSSIQATVLGILEMVKAAVAYAAPFGAGSVQGAKHTAAAAQAFALAAVMAGLAVFTHAASGGYSGRGGGGGGVGGGGGYSNSQTTIAPRTESINLNNTIVLDGEPIYQSVESRAISRTQQGRRGLSVNNG